MDYIYSYFWLISASFSHRITQILKRISILSSVLSHCQVHQIPAVLYQCYTDVISPDSITMETFKPALLCLSKLVKVSEYIVEQGGEHFCALNLIS